MYDKKSLYIIFEYIFCVLTFQITYFICYSSLPFIIFITFTQLKTYFQNRKLAYIRTIQLFGLNEADFVQLILTPFPDVLSIPIRLLASGVGKSSGRENELIDSY
jgi:hypothetical protein